MIKCDQARIDDARRLIIRRLEEYGYADSVITAVLGVSESTLHRVKSGRYIKRRASKEVNRDDQMIAKELAVRVLLMGDFSVAEIVGAIESSQADIYRRVKRIHEELEKYTPEQRERISRWISRHWLSDWEPLVLRDLRERRRHACWKRRKSASY